MVTDVGPVSAPTASLSDPTVAAVDNLSTTFTTTAMGALGPGATITLYAPSSTGPQYTIFPTDPSAYTIDDGTGGTDKVGSVQYDSEGSAQATLTLSASAITDDDPVTIAVTGVTNSAYASAAWSVDISTSSDPVPSPTAPIVLSPGPVVPADSSIVAYPSVVPPDGTSFVEVEIILNDSYGNDVAGQTVTLSLGSSHAVITPTDVVTNQSGFAIFHVTDATSEVLDGTVTDTSEALVVGNVLMEFADAVPTTLTLSSSDPDSPIGQPLTFTAAVNPAPSGGTVSFLVIGEAIPGCGAVPVDANGVARCTVALLPYVSFGQIQIEADYSDIPPVAHDPYGSSNGWMYL